MDGWWHPGEGEESFRRCVITVNYLIGYYVIPLLLVLLLLHLHLGNCMYMRTLWFTIGHEDVVLLYRGCDETFVMPWWCHCYYYYSVHTETYFATYTHTTTTRRRLWRSFASTRCFSDDAVLLCRTELKESTRFLYSATDGYWSAVDLHCTIQVNPLLLLYYYHYYYEYYIIIILIQPRWHPYYS